MLPELPGRYLVAPGTVLVDPGSTADRTWSCLVPGTRVPARRDACLIATLAGSPSAHSRHSPCASFRYLAVRDCVRNISPLPPRCWFICRRPAREGRRPARQASPERQDCYRAPCWTTCRTYVQHPPAPAGTHPQELWLWPVLSRAVADGTREQQRGRVPCNGAGGTPRY